MAPAATTTKTQRSRPRRKAALLPAAAPRTARGPVWAAQEAARATVTIEEVAAQIDARAQLLSVDDLMILLRFSRSAVLALNRRGQMPAPVRGFPGHPRWRATDITAWLATGCPPRRS